MPCTWLCGAEAPRDTVVVHSDHGCQFTSHEWQRFLASNSLQLSMSRRGNYHDNAVTESFFQLLKRERIRKQAYATREVARRATFSYIEMFYTPSAEIRLRTGCLR